MKVLFISTWFPNRIHPKNGNFVERHARCAAQFSELTVLNVQHDAKIKGLQLHVDDSVQNGYRLLIVYYGLPSLLGQAGKAFQLIRAYLLGIRRLRQYGRLSFDLIHANIILHAGIVARWLSWRNDIPYLITEQATMYTVERNRSLGGLKLWLSRWAAKKAQLVMPISKSLADGMKSVGIEGEYRILPNLVDDKLFRPRESFAENRIFTFLHVSNFIPQMKNVEGILQAANQLWGVEADFRLVIAGDGELAPLKAYAKKIGCLEERLNFLGPLTEAEVATQMKNAHCFVLFSNYETQSCVVVEAQVCGLPVIVSRVSGVVDVVDSNRLGMLVPARDVGELANAMAEMMNTYQEYDPAFIRRVAIERYGYMAIQRTMEAYYKLASSV